MDYTKYWNITTTILLTPATIYVAKKCLDWYLQRSIHDYLSRSERISKKEFEIIGQLWELLKDAHDSVSSLVAVFQTIPLITNYPKHEQKEILRPLNMLESDIEKILNGSDPQEEYRDALIRFRAEDCRDKIGHFNSFLGRSSIYVTSDLEKLFWSASKELQGAVLSYQIGNEGKDFKLRAEGNKIVSDKVKVILDEIKKKAQVRIHFNP